MAITPEQARQELLRRRQQQNAGSEPTTPKPKNLWEAITSSAAFTKAVKDPAIGVLEMGREFANLPNKISGGRIPELSPSDFDFSEQLGVTDPDMADKIIQFAGQYAPAMVMPGANLGKAGQAISKIPYAGKYAAKALSEAIPQGLYAASQSSEEPLKSGVEAGTVAAPFAAFAEAMTSPNKSTKLLAQILAGGGSALLGREAAKEMGTGETISDLAGAGLGALALRGMGTKRDLMKKLTEGVNPQLAAERQAAADRLGLDYLTPAEAGVSPWASRRQGALGRTEEGGKMLYERGLKRQESERNAINKTLDAIYTDEEMSPKIKKAYEEISAVNLPTDFPVQYQDNAIIKAAEKRVKSRPAYKESLKKLLPENVKLQEGQAEPLPTSLVYWDHVKRALWDMEQEASRKGAGSESNILSETRRDLVNQMDSHFPEYAQARGLYERKKTRQGLEKVFDQKEITGSNFYRALASENKFNELLGHLKDAPQAVQNLKDMRMLFDNLLSPPTIKTAKGGEERGMFQSRNQADFIKQLFEHAFTKGKSDKAAIDFITSKDWAKQMQDINKITDKQLKSVALGLALSRGVDQYAGQY